LCKIFFYLPIKKVIEKKIDYGRMKIEVPEGVLPPILDTLSFYWEVRLSLHELLGLKRKGKIKLLRSKCRS